MFSISFLNEPNSILHDPVRERVGEIVIGPFRESFISDITFWTPDDYELQWKDGLRRSLEGETSSCLLSNVVDPRSANFFRWWLVYREGGALVFQDALLSLDKLDRPFSFGRLYDYVPSYKHLSEEGKAISEWRIDVRRLAH